LRRYLSDQPRASEILGLRAYPDLASVPGVIDLALVCTAAATVPDIIDQCGRKGVKGAVVLALGSRESGAEGGALERRALEAAQRWNVRLVGRTPLASSTRTAGSTSWVLRFAQGGIGNHFANPETWRSRWRPKRNSTPISASAPTSEVGNESDLRSHDYLRISAPMRTRTPSPCTAKASRIRRGFSRRRLKLRAANRSCFAKAGGQRRERGRRARTPEPRCKLSGRKSVPSRVGRRGGRTLRRNPSRRRVPGAAAADAVAARSRSSPTAGARKRSQPTRLLPPDCNCPSFRSRRAQVGGVLTPQAVTVNPVDVANSADSAPGVIAECADIVLADPAVDALLVVGMFGVRGR
jgi:acetyltransferase